MVRQTAGRRFLLLSEPLKELYSRGKKIMQKQNYVRQSSGAKAIAIDNRLLLIRYRILQLIALILGAASAIGLHYIFAR